MELFKYPRTPHIEGSRFQAGDEDLDSAPFEVIAGRSLVLEEKVDGANAGISFSPEGQLFLQSRGHFLTGGGREKHFALFKRWAGSHHEVLWSMLGSRYTLYGEWLYAKHTIFYDALPHYFLCAPTPIFLPPTRHENPSTLDFSILPNTSPLGTRLVCHRTALWLYSTDGELSSESALPR